MPPIRFRGPAVHVWLADPTRETEQAVLDAYDALMSPDEREKQRRFHFERDRRICLVTRALVRSTLSRYVDVPPEAWRFEQNEHGRPEIAAGQCAPDLRFNLSHTPGLIACAVTLDREIGVDVEFMPRKSETVAIADRYFSPSEVGALRALPPERQRKRFFQYWTLKESYIKARGMGLVLPLDQFSFSIEAASPIGISFDPRLRDDPRSWQFELHQPSAEHVMAVGVRRGPGPDLPIEIRRIVPLL